MTHEENQRCAINYLIELKKSTKGYGANWLDLAIKALEQQPSDDCISRKATIDALWKALYEYENKTEKQFIDSEELDVADWFQHRVFVQNMSDIDRQTILNMPSVIPQPKIGHWIIEEVKDEDGRPYDIKYFCSECQAERPPIWDDYCSACGAKMEVEDKESEE